MSGTIVYTENDGLLKSDSKLSWDDANDRLGVGTTAPDVTLHISATDAILLPVGTTAQRPSASSGMLRFNSTTSSVEGYNGTTWTQLGTTMPPVVFVAAKAVLPLISPATSSTRNDRPIIAYNDATASSAYWEGALPATYASGGLTVTIIWAAASATANSVVWDVAIERHDAAGIDIDSDSFSSDNSATEATQSTSGQLTYTEITFTDGADMDSLAAGESFRIRIQRDAANGSDDMSGDAQVLRVIVEET